MEDNKDLNESVDGDVYSKSRSSREDMSSKSKKESTRSKKETLKGAKSVRGKFINIQDQNDEK